MKRRDYSGAEAALTQARTLAPGNPYVLLNLGSLYAKECKTDEALDLYNQVAAREHATPTSDDTVAGVAFGGASDDINNSMRGKSPAYIARYNLARVKPCAAALRSPVRKEVVVLSAIQLFAFDSAQLTPQQPELDQIAAALRDNPKIEQKVVIKGYADELGSDEHNLELSQRRADAVKAYLVSKSLPGSRIVAQGRGTNDPRVQCPSMPRDQLIKCLAPNRRIEVEQLTFERISQ
ncbi:outer membrane protein OmpA-like peptidoglycan-associated protein [Variovorax boronicumulans]|uniref:OmpA family protein n=1 Tax=Variovorax boronicumulans TaxID=436515 RepID=UPI00277E6343|nr:OmpA family protein [Variovorax boronicumulans]MDQ0086071.1 outer membrane protein OmpA-like peptidoglycan-associated protein [Variovorax boronicumulans]